MIKSPSFWCEKKSMNRKQLYNNGNWKIILTLNVTQPKLMKHCHDQYIYLRNLNRIHPCLHMIVMWQAINYPLLESNNFSVFFIYTIIFSNRTWFITSNLIICHNICILCLRLSQDYPDIHAVSLKLSNMAQLFLKNSDTQCSGVN